MRFAFRLISNVFEVVVFEGESDTCGPAALNLFSLPSRKKNSTFLVEWQGWLNHLLFRYLCALVLFSSHQGNRNRRKSPTDERREFQVIAASPSVEDREFLVVSENAILFMPVLVPGVFLNSSVPTWRRHECGVQGGRKSDVSCRMQAESPAQTTRMPGREWKKSHQVRHTRFWSFVFRGDEQNGHWTFIHNDLTNVALVPCSVLRRRLATAPACTGSRCSFSGFAVIMLVFTRCFIFYAQSCGKWHGKTNLQC